MSYKVRYNNVAVKTLRTPIKDKKWYVLFSNKNKWQTYPEQAILQQFAYKDKYIIKYKLCADLFYIFSIYHLKLRNVLFHLTSDNMYRGNIKDVYQTRFSYGKKREFFKLLNNKQNFQKKLIRKFYFKVKYSAKLILYWLNNIPRSVLNDKARIRVFRFFKKMFSDRKADYNKLLKHSLINSHQLVYRIYKLLRSTLTFQKKHAHNLNTLTGSLDHHARIKHFDFFVDDSLVLDNSSHSIFNIFNSVSSGIFVSLYNRQFLNFYINWLYLSSINPFYYNNYLLLKKNIYTSLYNIYKQNKNLIDSIKSVKPVIEWDEFKKNIYSKKIYIQVDDALYLSKRINSFRRVSSSDKNIRLAELARQKEYIGYLNNAEYNKKAKYGNKYSLVIYKNYIRHIEEIYTKLYNNIYSIVNKIKQLNIRSGLRFIIRYEIIIEQGILNTVNKQGILSLSYFFNNVLADKQSEYNRFIETMRERMWLDDLMMKSKKSRIRIHNVILFNSTLLNVLFFNIKATKNKLDVVPKYNGKYYNLTEKNKLDMLNYVRYFKHLRWFWFNKYNNLQRIEKKKIAAYGYFKNKTSLIPDISGILVNKQLINYIKQINVI